MKKKILVLNSPLFEDKDTRNTEDYLPPLGLGLIVSAADKKHDVKLVDALAEDLSIEEIYELISNENPHFIGINVFTTNYKLVKKIVEGTQVKTHWIIGGISTKSLYKEIFKWKTSNPLDIIYGDGELISKDIIDATLTEQPNERDKNRRFFIVCPSSKYYVNDISAEALNRKLFRREPQINVNEEHEVCIYTSRGCPFNCAYCVAASSRNKELGKIRHKSTESIINELANIKALYPEVKAIRVLDDLFLRNPQSFKQAISIFSKFEFVWRAMCHIKSIMSVDDEILRNIATSGCKELFIGIESGSSQILQKIHKTHDIQAIENSIRRVLSSGINVKGYFICGFPNEQKDDLEKTLALATRLRDISIEGGARFRNSTFQFRPYFGTELYDEIVKTLKIPYDFLLTEMKPSVELNQNVRNKAFNFDSGNFSAVDESELMHYLKKMEALNGN